MNEQEQSLTINEIPSKRQAEQIRQTVTLMFQRTLSSWASDLLRLRQTRMRYPSWSTEVDDIDLSRAA